MGQNYKVKNWRNFLNEVLKILYDLIPEKINKFPNDDDFHGKKRKLISDTPDGMREAIKINDISNIYFEGNLSAISILNLVKLIMEKCDLSLDDLIYWIEK